MSSTPRRVLAGLAAIGAGFAAKGLLARHRAVADVAPELRQWTLYLPLSLNSVTLAVFRKQSVPRPRPHPGVRTEQRTVPAGGGVPAVGVSVHRKEGGRRPGGVVVWIHGGGMVLGSAAASDAWCARLAGELDVLVVNVDYRLAPEHPYPAALDDCYRVLRWVHDNAAELGVDPDRVAVSGKSAGAGLAAALAQRAYDTGVPVRFQALVYPMLDDRTVLRTDHGNRGAFVWTPAANRFGWTAYLGHPPRVDDDRPYAAPARRTDLTGLPPAWIGVGDLDLFHDEDVDYAHRLRAAGVPCALHVEPGMYHGADGQVAEEVPSMAAFRERLVDALRTALEQ
ncbi:Esterase/lipase [Actinokineospora spheciospongiae]|uniref:Esterase/lipase n=1 Tax=Actinokineospora spheciospongiae TaxID=909613 RepID=W7IPS3_9PSEU|nr:alpha/beta hydrolase [Actinokineospora spheciospongiae]EWC62403.1 Esterase/lipase [Actinokineospora spheciospongiae]